MRHIQPKQSRVGLFSPPSAERKEGLRVTCPWSKRQNRAAGRIKTSGWIWTCQVLFHVSFLQLGKNDIFFSLWAVDHLKQFSCGNSPCGISFLEMLLELAGLAGDLGQITIQLLQPCSFSNERQERGICFKHSWQGRFFHSQVLLACRSRRVRLYSLHCAYVKSGPSTYSLKTLLRNTLFSQVKECFCCVTS